MTAAKFRTKYQDCPSKSRTVRGYAPLACYQGYKGEVGYNYKEEEGQQITSVRD